MIGKPEWAHDPAYATARARQPHIFDIFADIEKWLADKTKFEAVEILRPTHAPDRPDESKPATTSSSKPLAVSATMPSIRRGSRTCSPRRSLRGNRH